MGNKKDRTGECGITNEGERVEIIKYNSFSDIEVKIISSGEIIKSTYKEFLNGNIKSHFTPTIYGVGWKGLFPSKINGIDVYEYSIWHGILKRCYDKNFQEKQPTYKDCIVCKEWHFYGNFKKWFNDNYYEFEDEKMCVDKDILIKGNKFYCRETCIIVPQRINNLFTKNNIRRGKYPIGVYYKRDSKKFRSKCSICGDNGKKFRQIYLGEFNTPEEAFYKYKEFKENYIKEVAEEYKNKIPIKLYEAMINYKVDIND